ncbi:hypothetical protein SteCoe_9902 [Stentor coeruleus]|uniref:RZ-type domain-containing protein n=1 Tax=Stentor coeruleus TaxID=5963 RepID=A0A1R2CGT4_9CILI|nr:hypothetical protein SteCoe_9902 [Stentor coeruleus]
MQLLIYLKPEHVPAPIKDLYATQKTIENKIRAIDKANKYNFEDYLSFDSQKLIKELLSFLDKPLTPKNQVENYSISPDNFVKMCLIIVKAFSGIPVIIMGETGCGKTSLIRFMVTKILDEHLELVNVHSGTTYENIKEITFKYIEEGRKTPDKRFWVFFDEFNTSDCIGVISNLMVDRKFEGKEIPSNVYFLAACNPYRLKSTKFEMREDLGLQKGLKYRQVSSGLMHIVKPLPYKILEFVSDFGSLKNSELHKYTVLILNNMINNQIASKYSKLICSLHEYYSNSEDVSSVSLRDVIRFTKLYNWFNQSIKVRKLQKMKKMSLNFLKENNFEPYNKNDNQELIALVLSLTHCYYLRLPSTDQRDAILDIIGRFINKDINTIKNIIKREQFNIISRFRISDEIAVNDALRENIYAIIPCLMVKIPVFLCGKPGCSKSLSVQLIFSNLQGQASYDDYFQTLPDLYMVFFQGSDTCTSEGIIKVFDKASKKFSEKQLSVVVFDEIGLAEVSKHNPLKVLHSLLENENIKTSFIGISNWRLDASKMNRALYLSRFDPNEKDINETGNMICKSLQVKDMPEYVERISKFYFTVKNSLKDTVFRDFYGLRDFYSVVKMTHEKLKYDKNQDQNYISIIIYALLRNFGGLTDIKEILNQLMKKYLAPFEIQLYNTLYFIKDNLSEKSSRYLMIIAKKELIPVIIRYLIKEYISEYEMITGSNFEAAYEEKNCFNILSNVVKYMEKGLFVLFHNADAIYSSLYDLFNQNFTKFKDRRYCRVGLGSHLNPRCLVNENFKAIVFVEDSKEKLQFFDPPFLNRFEKHHITVDTLITKKHKNIAKIVEDWLNKLMTVNLKIISTPKKVLIPIYNRDFLLHLAYINSKEIKDKDLNAEICIDYIIKSSTVELLILSDICSHEESTKASIKKKWQNFHIGFESQLDNIMNTPKNKLVVITYDTINIEQNINEELKNKIYFQKVKHFKIEQEFKMDLDIFNKSDKSLYLLEINYEYDDKIWEDIFWIIDGFKMRDPNKALKPIIIIVRLMRYSEKILPGVLPTGWDIVMYDDLLKRRFEYNDRFVNKTDCEILKLLFTKEKIEENYEALLIESFKELNFDRYSDKETDAYIKNSIEVITGDDVRRNFLTCKIFSIIEKSYEMKIWINKLFFSTTHNEKLLTAHDIIENYVKSIFVKEQASLLNWIERKNTMESFTNIKDGMYEYWINIFNKLTFAPVKNNSMPIKRIKNLKTPFILDAFNKLDELFKAAILNNQEYDLIYILSMQGLSKTILSNQNRLINANNTANIEKCIILDIAKILLSKDSINIFLSKFAKFFLSLNNAGNELSSQLACLLENKAFFKNLCNIFMIGINLGAINKNDIKINQEEKICGIIYKICISMAPFPDNIKKLGGPDKYYDNLKKISNSIYSLNNFEHAKNDSALIIDFWMTIYELKLDLSDINTFVKHIENDNIASDNFIRRFLNKLITIKTQEINNIKSKYCSWIIQKSPNFIDIIINEINTSELWKCSGIIFKELMIKLEIVNTLEIHNMIPDEYFTSNPYANKIDIGIQNNLNSFFSVLLSDFIGHDLKQFIMSLTETNFNQIKEELLILKNKRPLTQLIYQTFLRILIEDFTYNANQPNQSFKNNFIQNLLATINEDLVYRVHFLKCLKTKKYINDKEALKNQIESFFEIKNESFKLEVNPMVIKSRVYYEKYLKLELYSHESGDFDINQCLPSDDPYDILGFLLYFLNNAYFNHRFNKSNENIKRWVDLYEQQINQRVGFETTQLIKSFINNFPKGSPFYLDKDDEISLVLQKMNYCFILCIIFSLKNNFDPLVSIFFNHQTRALDPDLLKNSFCVGTEMNSLYHHLKYYKENFESLKSATFMARYSKGGFNKCSCGFMYIIQNCGGPVLVGKCQNCKLDIGGTGHKWIERPGHENLSNEEAMAYIDNSISKTFEFPGLKLTTLTCDTSIRNMKKCDSFNILRLIVSVIISSSSIIFTDKMHAYQTNLKNNLRNFTNEQCLKLPDELNFYYSQLKPDPIWLMSILSELPDLMIENSQKIPINKDIRNAFEANFERMITSKIKEDRITDYKKKSNSEISKIQKYIIEIEQVDPTFGPLFRMKMDPSENDMRAQLQSIENKQQYTILTYFLSNYENILSLKYLYPIIKLSNHMLKCYDQNYTRSEAHRITIKELITNDNKLKKYFSSFKEAIENIKFPVRYNCFENSEKIDYNEDSSLNWFFIELSQNEGKILAAILQTLAKTQNQFLSMILEEKDQKNDQFIQLSKKQDIIQISKNINELISEFTVINPNYGKGQFIIYNFKGMQDFIIECTCGVKIFNDLDLRFCTYKNEVFLNPEGDILSDFRKSIQQVPLTLENKKLIKRYLKNIVETNYEKVLENIKASLEQIMKKSKNQAGIDNQCIHVFANNINMTSIITLLNEANDLSNFMIVNLVEIYEIVEKMYFKFYKKEIPDKFKKPIRDVVGYKNIIETFYYELNDRPNILPSAKDAKNALMRLMSRNLLKIEDEEKSIGLEIINYSLWSELNCEKIGDAGLPFPQTLKFKNIYEIYIMFSKTIKELG